MTKKALPIANAIKLPYCEYVETFVTESFTYYVSIFDKISGLNWYETSSDLNTYYNAGVALGKIHEETKKIKVGLSRKTWAENQYLCDFDRAVKDDAIINKKNELIKEIKSLDRDSDVYGLVHGDYNYANMIYNGNNVTVYDFDELEYGFYVYDIAVYLFYYLLGADPLKMDIEPNVELFKSFIKGYKKETTITDFEIGKLPVFFRLREFILLSSILRNNTQLGKWQEAFYNASTHRIKNNLPFVDIDYVQLFNEI